MGIIKRQAFKQSIVSYAGALLGIISTLWIYPLALSVHGEIRYILSFVTFLMPFASLGIPTLTVRFFPQFKEKDSHAANGFLGIILTASVLAFVLFAMISIAVWKPFVRVLEKLDWDVKVLLDNKNIIFGSLLLAIVQSILVSYCRNKLRVVVPKILDVFGLKVLVPLVVLLYYCGFLSFRNSLESVFWIKLFTVLSLVIYLYSIGQKEWLPKLSPMLRTQSKSMFYFSSMGILAQVGTIMATQIDIIMVRFEINAEYTSIYAIAVVLAGLIVYPYQAVAGISGPIVSQAWKDKDLGGIQKLYSKSSNTLLASGLAIFGLIIINIDDILKCSADYESLKLGIPVVLFIGVARVFDSASSINSIIIGYSKLYYFNTIVMILMAFSTVYLNILLIPKYGMIGSAVGSCIAILGFNLAGFVFAWVKFGLQPFDLRSLYILLIFSISTGIMIFTPVDFHFLLNIFVRSLSFLVMTMPMILYFNLTPEIRTSCQQLMSRLERFVR